MGAAAAVATVVSTVASAAGAQKRANAERRSLRAQAALQQKQAEERERQLERDVDIFESKGEVAFGDAVSSYAKAGVSVGAGSPLLALASTENNIKNNLAELKIRGRKEVESIREGAMQLKDAANNIDPSLEVIGTIAGGVGNLASMAKPTKKGPSFNTSRSPDGRSFTGTGK